MASRHSAVCPRGVSSGLSRRRPGLLRRSGTARIRLPGRAGGRAEPDCAELPRRFRAHCFRRTRCFGRLRRSRALDRQRRRALPRASRVSAGAEISRRRRSRAVSASSRTTKSASPSEATTTAANWSSIPILTYSTYLGGTGTESFVHVAIGPDNNIYLAGSTNSADFPLPPVQPNGWADPPVQSCLGNFGFVPTPTSPCPTSTATNIFIAVINPTLQPPNYVPAQQLIYATYLGGSGTDYAAGVAVHAALDQLTSGFDVFVAGSTTSTDFPINGAEAAFEAGPGRMRGRLASAPFHTRLPCHATVFSPG